MYFIINYYLSIKLVIIRAGFNNGIDESVLNRREDVQDESGYCC